MTAPLSRRSFLAATGVAGLAAVAPFAAGRSAAGTRPRPVASRRAQPNDRIGLALIGCGKRMFEILGPLMDHPDLWVAGVCDVDTTRREEARRRVDAHNAAANPLADVIPCLSVVDYDELLSNDRIDAVVICTPDHWHANQVIDAAKAGKDIYCEKPLTQCLHECKAMIEAVRKHGRVFQTGSQQRTEYDHRFVRACELADAMGTPLLRAIAAFGAASASAAGPAARDEAAGARAALTQLSRKLPEDERPAFLAARERQRVIEGSALTGRVASPLAPPETLPPPFGLHTGTWDLG